MRVTKCLGLAAGTLEAMPTQPRAHAQSRGTMHLLTTAPESLSWTGKRGGLVSPMWDQCGIAPSTALNCASPLTGALHAELRVAAGAASRTTCVRRRERRCSTDFVSLPWSGESARQTGPRPPAALHAGCAAQRRRLRLEASAARAGRVDRLHAAARLDLAVVAEPRVQAAVVEKRLLQQRVAPQPFGSRGCRRPSGCALRSSRTPILASHPLLAWCPEFVCWARHIPLIPDLYLSTSPCELDSPNLQPFFVEFLIGIPTASF